MNRVHKDAHLEEPVLSSTPRAFLMLDKSVRGSILLYMGRIRKTQRNKDLIRRVFSGDLSYRQAAKIYGMNSVGSVVNLVQRELTNYPDEYSDIIALRDGNKRLNKRAPGTEAQRTANV